MGVLSLLVSVVQGECGVLGYGFQLSIRSGSCRIICKGLSFK